MRIVRNFTSDESALTNFKADYLQPIKARCKCDRAGRKPNADYPFCVWMPIGGKHDLSTVIVRDIDVYFRVKLNTKIHNTSEFDISHSLSSPVLNIDRQCFT